MSQQVRGTDYQETRSIAEPVLGRMEHMLCALNRRRVSRVFLVQDCVLLWEHETHIGQLFGFPFWRCEREGEQREREDEQGGGTLHLMRGPCAMSPKEWLFRLPIGDWEKVGIMGEVRLKIPMRWKTA